MIIYRVENDSGVGPFVGGDRDLMLYCRPHLLNHPDVCSFEEPWYQKEIDRSHVCGRSAAQHRNCTWTRWDYEWLAGQGFHLYRFTVPSKKVKMGRTQVTFPRGEWARERVSLTEMF